MANRSYLFSIDFDSTKEERDDSKKVCGLSEWNYSIPLSLIILSSQDAKISKSIIWDSEEPIAIVADFYKGRQKLFDFLDDLLEKDIFEPSKLEEAITQTRDFLCDPRHENPYIILECGEIFMLGSEDPDEDDSFEAQNKKLYENEILNIDKIIESAIEEFQKMKAENQKKPIEQEVWNYLGIDYWTDILYYC